MLLLTRFGKIKLDAISVVDKKITEHIDPTQNKSFISIFLFAKTIAFGGVPNGNKSARDTDNVRGYNIIIGFIGVLLLGPIHMNGGKIRLAAATLLIIFVRMQAPIDAKEIKEAALFFVINIAILTSKPDF